MMCSSEKVYTSNKEVDQDQTIGMTSICEHLESCCE